LENHLDRLRQLIFAHLDGELPTNLKRKLSSSETKAIVNSISHFIQDHKNLNVLLGITHEDQGSSRTSKFASDEDPKFLEDLSRV
jgi:hypothetical protein